MSKFQSVAILLFGLLLSAACIPALAEYSGSSSKNRDVEGISSQLLQPRHTLDQIRSPDSSNSHIRLQRRINARLQRRNHVRLQRRTKTVTSITKAIKTLAKADVEKFADSNDFAPFIKHLLEGSTAPGRTLKKLGNFRLDVGQGHVLYLQANLDAKDSDVKKWAAKDKNSHKNVAWLKLTSETTSAIFKVAFKKMIDELP